jgi:hypothetical protein
LLGGRLALETNQGVTNWQVSPGEHAPDPQTDIGRRPQPVSCLRPDAPNGRRRRDRSSGTAGADDVPLHPAPIPPVPGISPYERPATSDERPATG